jgi:hypothetical protein
MYFLRICLWVEKRGKNRGNTQLSRREEVERRAVYFGAHMCPGGGFFPPKSRWPGEWSQFPRGTGSSNGLKTSQTLTLLLPSG